MEAREREMLAGFGSAGNQIGIAFEATALRGKGARRQASAMMLRISDGLYWKHRKKALIGRAAILLLLRRLLGRVAHVGANGTTCGPQRFHPTSARAPDSPGSLVGSADSGIACDASRANVQVEPERALRPRRAKRNEKETNMDIIRAPEQQQHQGRFFNVGDTAFTIIKEGNRERIQVFQGDVIRRHGHSCRETSPSARSASSVGASSVLPGILPRSIRSRSFVTVLFVAPSCTTFCNKVGKAAKIKEKAFWVVYRKARFGGLFLAGFALGEGMYPRHDSRGLVRFDRGEGVRLHATRRLRKGVPQCAHWQR